VYAEYEFVDTVFILTYGINYLARSAKLPEGLYILPMFFLYLFFFIIFFNGRLSSQRS